MNETTETLRAYPVVRLRQLAEKRLDHITELFESGRWSRYFGENEFLDVIRRSKDLVEALRRLAPIESDSRLPASPFAMQGDDSVAQAFDAGEVEAETDTVVFDNESEDALLNADDAEPQPASLTEFQFEKALAVIALQRLHEAAAVPASKTQNAA